MVDTRRSQSIKIGTDLSIDKSIKVGKFELIDIDFIDQVAGVICRTPNAERRTPNAECRTPNAEHLTPNAECNSARIN